MFVCESVKKHNGKCERDNNVCGQFYCWFNYSFASFLMARETRWHERLCMRVRARLRVGRGEKVIVKQEIYKTAGLPGFARSEGRIRTHTRLFPSEGPERCSITPTLHVLTWTAQIKGATLSSNLSASLQTSHNI